MQELALFVMCFVLILLIYEFIFIKPLKNKNNKDKELLEVKYLITKYHLDMKKINYNQLLQLCAITSSFDIAVTVSMVSFVNGLLKELLVGFISIVLLIFITYHLVYLFYKKKGMILDGKHK